MVTIQQMAGFAIAGFGVYILCKALFAAGRVFRAGRWQQTTGVLTEAHVQGHWTKIGSSNDWIEEPVVSYEYVACGVRHVGHTLSLVEVNTASQEDARAKIRRFDVGEPVTVYFDPEDPGSSALDVSPRVVTTVVFVAVAGGLPIAIGVLFILGVVQF